MNAMLPPMSLPLFLEKHVLKEDILKVNRKLGVRASGTKPELIEALLAETDGSIKGTLRLFNKEVLENILRKLDSSPMGTKEELIRRIYSKGIRPARKAAAVEKKDQAVVKEMAAKEKKAPQAKKEAKKEAAPKAAEPAPKEKKDVVPKSKATTLPKVRLIPKE